MCLLVVTLRSIPLTVKASWRFSRRHFNTGCTSLRLYMFLLGWPFRNTFLQTDVVLVFERIVTDSW